MNSRREERSTHRRSGSPLLLMVALASLLLPVGCAGDEEPPPLVIEDHSGWSRTTTATLNFPVPGHGAGERKIFINPRGEEVEQPESASEPWNYPEGTVIVKEVYAEPDPPEDAPPSSLAIMVKAPDHPSNRGGWVWIGKEPGSDEQRIFTEQFCVTCHTNANEEHPYNDGNPEEQFRDYVYYPYTGE
mgnify:CR=1 FL=1